MKFKLISNTANNIIKIPIHCKNSTFSFNRKKANVTETGNSKAETILPKPTPVNGNPLFNKIGGKMVPNKANKMPHVY